MSERNDDELPSVRVEVAIDLGHDAPEGGVEPSISPSPRWGMGLAVAAVALVGVFVFLLRPDGDSAADGSQRQAPTTTTTTIAEDEPDEDEAQSIELPPTEEALLPIELDLPQPVNSMTSASPGFLALGGRDSSTPSIFRSLDGLDWFEIDTTVTPGSQDDGAFEWFTLIAGVEEFFALGFPSEADGFLPETDIFTSNSGADWVQLDGFGSLGPGNPRFVLGLNARSVYSLEEVDNAPLDQLLEEHSNLVLAPDDTLCFVIPDEDREPTSKKFILLTCSDEELSFDGSNVSSSAPPEEVVACMSAFAGRGAPRLFGLTQTSLSDPGDTTVIDTVQPIELPVLMSNGGLALVDFGLRDGLDDCAGLIDIPVGRDPAVVIVDGATGETTRSPLSELGGSNFERPEAKLLGTTTLAGGRSFVLVWYRQALWSIDAETGEWIEPFVQSEVGLEGEFLASTGAISESGDRAYVLTETELLTVDLFAGEDGTPQGIATESSLGGTTNFQFGQFGFADILHADDDRLFVRAGSNLWLLETPPIAVR